MSILPKPLHGWRELLGEVGIIVLGVLIALAAEQVVETIHMRSETDEARASMSDELGNDRARWEVTHSEYPCLVKRLDELRTGRGRRLRVRSLLVCDGRRCQIALGDFPVRMTPNDVGNGSIPPLRL